MTNFDVFISRDKAHVEWTNTWIETLSRLQDYVKSVHTTGLVWAKGGGIAGAPPPPPPPAFDNLSLDSAGTGGPDERSALFAEINQGEGITRSKFSLRL